MKVRPGGECLDGHRYEHKRVSPAITSNMTCLTKLHDDVLDDDGKKFTTALRAMFPSLVYANQHAGFGYSRGDRDGEGLGQGRNHGAEAVR